ncbi:hypothetical protein [Streptomyces sp. 7N604]|uniref:hypothetical protein n=1 Tax=Streptomyces sp. 7N604 TaxID=3457415 RepID=UPI003FD5E2B5
MVGQEPDGVLVNEGGTYQLYPTEQLSRPGEDRAPEPVDPAEEERQAQNLAAAMSPEGLELRGDNARLARLNLDEGHGEVLDNSGEVIGWIRRRGRTWYGQDARGGTRSSTSWTEDNKGGPLRAAELMASFVVLGARSDTMRGGQPFRHIRPEEVTAPIFYSALTDAQTRELRTLASQWKTVADPDLRTAAAQWSQEISTSQMRRLATAVEEVAAHTGTTTPQGRRRQGVLQRLAANIRSQAHAAEGAFSTLPPPGEPDPWAQPYRPEETQQVAAPTNAPLDTPARPDAAPPMASEMPGTVTADEHSEEDVDDAPQPEAAAQQATRDVSTPPFAPQDKSAAAMPSSAPPPLTTGRRAPLAAPDSPAATNLPSPTAETTAAQPQKPPGEATASTPAIALAEDWTLPQADVGAPHSTEAAAAAWALRGVLSDSALIDLMAAVDDDEAFARWKSRHMRYYGEGTGHVNKDLAPADGLSYKKDAKHFEARIADQTVNVTWDRIRAWLREATTPEALSLLHAAEEAGARLRGGNRGDALLTATGELALSRDLRSQVQRLTTQVLDRVVQFLATTPVPTGRRGKRSPRAAEDAALFDLTEAPVFELPGADAVRSDLDRLIAYLPDLRQDREPLSVPLSKLRAGMVLDRGDQPVVITEIIRHPGRCDIVGEFRGPVWPARIKHSVELTEQDPDPPIPLAPLFPSLQELTGRQPEPDDDETPGPLVEGHPALSAPAAAPRAQGEVAPPSTPPVPRMPDLVWDEQRRQAHGQAIAAHAGERPPLSARRRELDPDDPYAQFTDNLEHQLQQLSDHPDEHATVENAAREIRATVSDLAARARAYSTERLRTAESDPAQLLQITLEPSLSAPFVRVAMNAIMRAIDTAEAAVNSARAKGRVRAALAATVCARPPHDPQGDSARDFGDALVEFESVASDEQDTVAEVLAGPAQWAHFADMAARVEAATATPDPNPPAPRFADLDEVRAHLADLAVRPLPDIETDPAGLIRHELRGRAKFAGQLANDPTLELTPSGRLAIHGSPGRGWQVVAPGSADAIVPWSVKSRRHALRYAALLERLTDTDGKAYPWDADDFPSAQTPYEPQGGHLLYDWVESNHSHDSLGFHHRLRMLRETSPAYGWMEDLSRYGFSAFDYIHPATPADLQPGDEVMFTFDQDELDYASGLAGYFPPLQGGNLAIGTAVVGENRLLIPGFWWPHRHPDQAQRLTKMVSLRDGARRPRPGEYTLHAGITAHLPELVAHQAIEAPPLPVTGAAPDSPRAENSPAATPGATPAETLSPEPAHEAPTTHEWSTEAPSALADAPSAEPWGDDEAPAALFEPGLQNESAPQATPAAQDSPAPPATATATDPAPAQAETGEENEAPDADPDARWRERLSRNAAAGAILGIDPSAGESFEGYAGRFDGDYDITLPSGRYCYRTPGFDRKKYTVRYIPNPARAWESKQIGTVSRERDIMPMVRRHAAKHADPRDPHTVGLTEAEQQALDAVARGVIFRSLGEWYRVGRDGRASEPAFDWITQALWSLSALGLITVPPAQPDHGRLGHRQHAQLTEFGEQRWSGLRGEPDTKTMQPEGPEPSASSADAEPPATALNEQHADGAPPSPTAVEPQFPKLTKARTRALFDIARGDITEVDGVFMKRTPQRGIVTKARSQKAVTDILELGLAERAGQQIRLSKHGTGWFTHHNIKLPATGLRDTAALDASALPPIDYTPLVARPAADDQPGSPQPPAPAPLPADWHKLPRSARKAANIQAVKETAAAARARAARSTARDLEELAAGSDRTDRWVWRSQYPLAQYDENAAAALERLTDPVAHAYATQAVHKMRAAIEAVGREATEDYVQRIRAAGSDPVAMDKAWRTTQGIQADDTYRHRVRGIVITYLQAIGAHAEEAGLDYEAIVHVLEDAAGWNGGLQPLSLRHQTAHAYFPAAEEVADAARFVAGALHDYALGETGTVDAWADRRETWRTIGPRPALADRTSTDEHGPAGADGTLVGDVASPGPDVSPAEKVRFERRFDFPYRVGQFVDHRDDQGDIVTSRVVSEGINPILRGDDGHEFRALREFRQSRFVDVREDDGSALPPPAWTATLPDGYRAVAPDQVKPGDVVHDYRENGALWTSRLVIEVKENDGTTALTTVGLQKFSGVWLHYDHRAIAILDETEQSRQLAEAALRGREVRNFAKTFGISLAGTRIRPATEAGAPASPQKMQEDARPDQQAADTQDPGSDTAAEEAPPTHAPTAAKAGAPADSAANDNTPAPRDARKAPAREEATPAPPGPATQTVDEATEPASAPMGAEGTSAPQEKAPADPGQNRPNPASRPGTTQTRTGQLQEADTVPSGPPERATPETRNDSTSKPPATPQDEGSVASRVPPSADNGEEPATPTTAAAPDVQLDPQSAEPYPDAGAYSAAHEALLRELDQHEQWLAQTPAAAEAAAALAGADTLSLHALTNLLALQAAVEPDADHGNPRTRLAQRLGHHIRCTQLTMAKLILGQAARSTNTEHLREPHHKAFQGQFIDFVQQTEDGEMELSQYLQHRNEQITQQPARTEDLSDEAPATVEEATTMAMDPDDDIQLPVLELPGEAFMTAEEAAPRLLAHAQTHLAGGRPAVEPFAHIRGRPVYAMVSQDERFGPTLLLGLALNNAGGHARPVTIPGDDLAAVAAETLLTAVTAWVHAGDDGNRPLLDYAPITAAPARVTATQGREQPTPAQTEQPASAAEPTEPTAATGTAPTAAAPEPIAPKSPKKSVEPPAPAAAPAQAAAAPAAAPASAAPTAPAADGAVPGNPAQADPAQVRTADSGSGQTFSPARPPQPPAASPAPGAPPAFTAPRSQSETSGAASVEPAGTNLSSTAPTSSAAGRLSDAEVERAVAGLVSPLLEAHGLAEHQGITVDGDHVVVSIDPGTSVINAGRATARRIEEELRQTKADTGDRRLDRFRLDVQPAPPGQSTLGSAVAGVDDLPDVPRDRLIAACAAAHRFYIDALHAEGSEQAELARTYLGDGDEARDIEGRRLSPEAQRRWQLGLAPADRSQGRWRPLVTHLKGRGFSDDEIVAAGLAWRAKNNKQVLYDVFANRIMYPVHDAHGAVVGFTGRMLEHPGDTAEQAKDRCGGDQKYYNTRTTSIFSKGELVFGLFHSVQAEAKAASQADGRLGVTVSVEGPHDVIAGGEAAATLPLAERPVFAAPMGTAITPESVTAIRDVDPASGQARRTQVVCIDDDNAGRAALAAPRAWKALQGTAGECRVTRAGGGAKDLAALRENDIASGGDGARVVLDAVADTEHLLETALPAALDKVAGEHALDNGSFAGASQQARLEAVREAARLIGDCLDELATDDIPVEVVIARMALIVEEGWGLPAEETSTQLLAGPGFHNRRELEQARTQAVQLLETERQAADPEGFEPVSEQAGARDRAPRRAAGSEPSSDRGDPLTTRTAPVPPAEETGATVGATSSEAAPAAAALVSPDPAVAGESVESEGSGDGQGDTPEASSGTAVGPAGGEDLDEADEWLPVVDVPGDSALRAEDAGSVLHRRLAALLGGDAGDAVFGHVLDRQVYARVVDGKSDRGVLLSLAQGADVPRVHFTRRDLEGLEEARLWQAAQAWITAGGQGGGPLLSYAPAPAQAAAAPAAAPASAAPTAPAADGAVPGNPAQSTPAPATDSLAQQGATVKKSAPAPAQPAPAGSDPVDRLTGLARAALADLGVTLDATGVLTADRTVVITLETSGTPERDRELADNLRPALDEAIRQHPDRGLAAYRVDIAHTPQVGQGALKQDAPNAQAAPGTDSSDTDRAPGQWPTGTAAAEDSPSPTPAQGTAPAATDIRPAALGQWPAGARASGPVASPRPAPEPAPVPGDFDLSMFLPSPVDGQLTEHTDRTTAAYALHHAVHERLGQHTAETPEPDQLPQPLALGTVHGVELSTSGDDQTSEDPTVVVWLGTSHNDSLRLSYSRFIEMTGPELLAAVEWRAAQSAGLLGTPLSQTWRAAVRAIIPPTFPTQPTPSQFADLLDTIAQSPDASDDHIRHRAEQAVALYTAGHADLALNHLAAHDHIWVLRNDGSWIQEEAPGTKQTWEELDNGFRQASAELGDITQEAAAHSRGEPIPPAADLTVAHHSAHEALAALRPYSIGLPGTIYEKITDLVAQMDAAEPALRRLRGPSGEPLMNRAKTAFVRVLEGLATVASKIRLTGLSTRLERTVARLRGQDPDTLPAERAVRTDRRMQDLAHIERDLERRMAAPTTTLAERGELQEQWIINRARWRARFEQLTGLPPESDFLPDNDLVAGAPPVPNPVAAHDLLLDRLTARVVELRDTDPHTGEDGSPYDPTADLFNGVAWAYQQRLIGTVPTGDDPQGPIPLTQLRRAALIVTSHQDASPLTLRRTMSVTAERADRLLHRLEEQQILGPYRPDAPRTVLARPSDIDALLARPATPPALRKPAAEPAPAPAAPGADPDALDEARIHKMVNKILTDQQKRSETRGEPDPAERTAPASRVRKTGRKSAHKEAEANALAAGQPTSLAPSQT